ncbi:BolA-like family protein [Actinidia rufa]|uniref:BolA-like family protein n=1 Tax=Actinidia rufa TaxID=165716 RepID=A0A7J0EB64_9ERIC|nr:BolA-like family protein [Actinidia rufa]
MLNAFKLTPTLIKVVCPANAVVAFLLAMVKSSKMVWKCWFGVLAKGLKRNHDSDEVIDTSGGCGASFAVEIVSAQFEGKRLLERHRMVNAALVEEMKEIHALSIKKALTPDQWKQQQESEKSQSAA